MPSCPRPTPRGRPPHAHGAAAQAQHIIAPAQEACLQVFGGLRFASALDRHANSFRLPPAPDAAALAASETPAAGRSGGNCVPTPSPVPVDLPEHAPPAQDRPDAAGRDGVAPAAPRRRRRHPRRTHGAAPGPGPATAGPHGDDTDSTLSSTLDHAAAQRAEVDAEPGASEVRRLARRRTPCRECRVLPGRGWTPLSSPLSLRALFLLCKGFLASCCQERAEHGRSLCARCAPMTPGRGHAVARLEAFPAAAQAAVHTRRLSGRGRQGGTPAAHLGLPRRPLGGAAGPSARPSTWRAHLGAAHVGAAAAARACARRLVPRAADTHFSLAGPGR